jgi:tetratricopeptide (TPR) repeat protein
MRVLALVLGLMVGSLVLEWHPGLVSGVIAQTVEEGKEEADRLMMVGFEQYQISEFPEAIASWEQALELYRQVGNESGESRVLANLANVYRILGDYPQAEDYYRRSLEIALSLGDLEGESNASNGLGNVYLSLGDYPQAEEYYRRSLEIALSLGDQQQQGNVLNNLGIVYRRLGEFAQAEEFYLRSLEIARLLGDQAGEGKALNNLGIVYRSLGEYTKAEEFYQQSLAISRLRGDQAGEGDTLNNLAIIYRRLGEFAQAQEYSLRSLEIARMLGNKPGEARTLNNLGNIYNSLGELTKAEEYYRRSLEIARLLGNKAAESDTLGSLGLIYQNLGEFAKAEEYYQNSLEIARQIGDKVGEGNTLSNLGNVYRYLKDYAKAEEFYLASIELREQLRPGLTDEQKISWFEQQAKTYEFLQTVLVAQNKTDAALEIAERGRARAFVELLTTRLFDTPENSFTVNPPNLTEIKQIAASQNATIVQYSSIHDGFVVDNVQLIGESELYIWVIKPTGEITFRRTELQSLWQEQDTSLETLIAHARCFDNFICRRHLAAEENRQRTPQIRGDRPPELNPLPPSGVTVGSPQLQKLHQLLIEPIADLLPQNPNERVIFIPHKSLFLVPFPALQNASGEYLIEQHTILTAPSIQVLAFTREKLDRLEEIPPVRTPGSEILIVGNPIMPVVEEQQLSPLLGAEQEARDIGQLLNVTPLIGSQATKSTVIEKMQSARIIHLATHGSFDSNIPLDSWLALTPSKTDNGLLTAAEIFGLELNAELVVLSACDTGRGRITGDGVIGLSRSFISAGVPTVLVSLWQVPDDSTSVLMREFYEILQENDDKAQALRQAMLRTMQQHPSPEEWAGFTLIGEAD